MDYRVVLKEMMVERKGRSSLPQAKKATLAGHIYTAIASCGL